MISRVQSTYKAFPPQFWLISLVMMLAWTFHSMLWPYIMLYSSNRLQQPLTTIAVLVTVFSVTGMVTTFLGGVIADKYGRKWVMVFSLVLCGVGWFLFRFAGVMPLFALLMALTGATTPLYRLAADAMVADLVPPENRLDAYSYLRMGNNLGVALGPAVGGVLAAISYNISFTLIGVGLALCALLVAVFARETKPASVNPSGLGWKDYGRILRDRKFLTVLGGFSLNRICTSTLWLLLAVYAKENFGLSERLFGLIPTTNAVMVILFQLLISRWTKPRPPERSMVLGAFIYAVAIFSVAFGHGFWGFWLCMVFATIGEMIMVPTTTTYTSSIAPEDMRARYMSVYAFTWSIGLGLGPLIGGFMNDTFSPRSTWYSAGLIGFAGMLVLMTLLRRKGLPKTGQSTAESV